MIGTSGYSYNEWVGPVYPAGTRSRDFLSLYAQEFDTVELNFSYYQMPKATQLQKMIQESGKALHYSIKAHQSLTPHHRLRFLEGLCRGVLPGRGRAVPGGQACSRPVPSSHYSFHYEADQRRYLDAILRECSAFPLGSGIP